MAKCVKTANIKPLSKYYSDVKEMLSLIFSYYKMFIEKKGLLKKVPEFKAFFLDSIYKKK